MAVHTYRLVPSQLIDPATSPDTPMAVAVLLVLTTTLSLLITICPVPLADNVKLALVVSVVIEPEYNSAKLVLTLPNAVLRLSPVAGLPAVPVSIVILLI